MRMSDTFVINVKVIAWVSFTIFMAAFTMIGNNYLQNARDSNKKMMDKMESIDAKLNELVGDYKVEKEKINGQEKINTFQNDRLNIMDNRIDFILGIDSKPSSSRLGFIQKR